VYGVADFPLVARTSVQSAGMFWGAKPLMIMFMGDTSQNHTARPAVTQIAAANVHGAAGPRRSTRRKTTQLSTIAATSIGAPSGGPNARYKLC
jgi:hypothetical protein